MGKRKKSNKDKELTFGDVFGEFDAKGSDTVYRPVILHKVDDGRAHPCNDCGEYPTVHDIYFRDKDGHPLHYYITCGICSSCDGKWYGSEEEAIEAWNVANPLDKVAVDLNRRNRKEFVEDILKYTKIAD